jgi:hypothetical protein
MAQMAAAIGAMDFRAPHEPGAVLGGADGLLADRGIEIVDSICGGRSGCKVEYWPASGKLIHTPLGQDRKA